MNAEQRTESWAAKMFSGVWTGKHALETFLAAETYARGVCSAGGVGGQCLLFRDFFPVSVSPVSVSLGGFEPDRRDVLPVPSRRFLIARGLASSGITRMG